MNHISPMFGVSYKRSQNIHFYSHYSTAFQTPTTTELSNRPDGVGGFNPQLGPETVENLELGIMGLIPDNNLQLAFALFDMRIYDMLIPYQIESDKSEEIYYRNAGQAKSRGFESTISWHPFRCVI